MIILCYVLAACALLLTLKSFQDLIEDRFLKKSTKLKFCFYFVFFPFLSQVVFYYLLAHARKHDFDSNIQLH